MKLCIIEKRGRGKIVSGVVNLVHNIKYAQMLPPRKNIFFLTLQLVIAFQKIATDILYTNNIN
jgi:hypothetical protein